MTSDQQPAVSDPRPGAARAPSPTIVGSIAAELRAWAPFGEFESQALNRFASALTAVYFAAGDEILAPGATAPAHLYLVKSGRVIGERPGIGGQMVPAMELLAGELFPIGAVLTDRPIQSRFRAATDCFCYRMPAARFNAEVQRNPMLQDFAERRLFHLLERSRASLRAAYTAERLSEHPFAQPLSTLLRRPTVACAPDSAVRDALQLMSEQKVGAIVLVGADGQAQGILTERDVIDRIALPQLPLSTPVRQIASHPVVQLDESVSLSVAALSMVEHGFRHVVVTRAGRVAGVVSERSLFTLQRQTIAGLGDALRNAPDLAGLIQCANDIRTLSRSLIAQGVSAGLLTQLVSGLNDRLTQRLLELESVRHGLAQIEGLRWCWLAFGSEGRHEQTISTDQDNGIIFALDDRGEPPAAAEHTALAGAKARLLAFAADVNQALAACGFPLCHGNIMAGNPELTLTGAQWAARFARWIDAGDPHSLLQANIFFDFRALAGDRSLADALAAKVLPAARANARFRKQMAENALSNRPLLDWLGRIGSEADGPAGTIDLKRHGAMPFTDAARLLALACAVPATRSVERLHGAAEALKIPDAEVQAWCESFEFVQMLRLRHQHNRLQAIEQGLTVADNPNLVPLDTLSELDKRILKEAFRQARKLQQRIEADYAS